MPELPDWITNGVDAGAPAIDGDQTDGGTAAAGEGVRVWVQDVGRWFRLGPAGDTSAADGAGGLPDAGTA